jgi:ABC-type transporter Mla MlaB component
MAFMATMAAWLKIDENRVIPALQEAAAKLDSVEGELLLDFSSVCRIDASVLQKMEELAGIADGKDIKVELRGVNVNVYKVLKLVKLASRFSFVN